MTDICIVCATYVRPRQLGIMCDSCHKWQHCTCRTGISLAKYRAAVQNGTGVPFMCLRCERHNPTADEHGATFIIQTSLLSEGTQMETTDSVNDSTGDGVEDDTLNSSNVGMNRAMSYITSGMGYLHVGFVQLHAHWRGESGSSGTNTHQVPYKPVPCKKAVQLPMALSTKNSVDENYCQLPAG